MKSLKIKVQKAPLKKLGRKKKITKAISKLKVKASPRIPK